MRANATVIDGIAVQMVEVSGGFVVLGDGKQLAILRHSEHNDEEHGRWICGICEESSGKKGPMLTHVVRFHAAKLITVAPANGRTLEAILTPLKLFGYHADPTYDAAIEHRISRFSWPS